MVVFAFILMETMDGAPEFPLTLTPPETMLSGVRVVSIATNVPGPVAVARLVALGASALKVEPPGGDYLAFAARAWYDALRAGQDRLTLDLKRADERELLFEELAGADVLLTSHRPSALERMGLSGGDVQARAPRTCMVRIVGHDGEAADRPGHDLTYQAEAGLLTPPMLPASLFVDLASGEAAATTACALLILRARTGEAEMRDVVMLTQAHELAAPRWHGLSATGGLLGGALPGYGVYATRHGFVAVAALEPAFVQRLAGGLGLDELTGAALARAFSARSASEWAAWGRANDVPIAVVATPAASGS